MVSIIPAILATSEEEYQDKITRINNSGAFNDSFIQVDIMDEKFVDNKSVSLDIVSKYPSSGPLEAHLMVQYPEGWVDQAINAGFKRIIIPVEENIGLEERLSHLANHSVNVGLSINPQTPIEALEPFIGTIDIVLVMGVEPGFSGQQFIPDTLDKIRQIKEKNWPVEIEVDGGVDNTTVKDLVNSGVDYLVIGSYLFEGDDINDKLEEIWETIHS